MTPILLSDGVTTIELPGDLFWSDEYGWAGATQSFTRSVSGALIIQSAAKQAGRPITLEPPQNGAWMTRADLALAQAWADTPDKQMTLTLQGGNYSVMFRQDGGLPVEAKPVMFFADPQPDHYVTATFRFITI